MDWAQMSFLSPPPPATPYSSTPYHQLLNNEKSPQMMEMRLRSPRRDGCITSTLIEALSLVVVLQEWVVAGWAIDNVAWPQCVY